MDIKQISVFLENNAGRLADVTRVLAEANINIRAISIADTADFGILRLIVDKTDAAIAALAAANFTARATPVAAVEIGDTPGCLAQVMELFQKSDINIEYLYASLEGAAGKAVVILKMDNLEKGIGIIKARGLKLIEKF